MNIKYYIRGLGMGILVTTVILTVSNHMRNRNTSDGAVNGDIIQASEQYETGKYSFAKEDSSGDRTNATGQDDGNAVDVSVDSSATSEGQDGLTDAEVQKETTQGTGQQTVQATTQTPVQTVTQAALQTTTQATTQTASQSTTTQSSASSNQSVSSGGRITVSLENVNSSEAAAQAVEAAGLVDSWRDFNTYLINNGYDRKISTGVYEFQGGEDYASIASTITRGR